MASVANAAEGPFGGTPAPIPGTVQAENYDTGGQGVAYNVTSIHGTGNSYRSDGVDLEVTTDTGGGYNLGWTAAGQWFKYTVNVATAGTYKVTFRVAAESAIADAFHISNSAGTNLSGSVAVPDTGAWQTWTNVTAMVTLPAGTQTLTINQDAAGWNMNYASFAAGSSGTEGPFGGTPAAVPGTVQAENYDTGGQGVAYNVTSTNGTGNSYRTDGVDLEVTTDTGGGYNVGWTAAGQWFKYTVDVATAGSYTVTFRVAAESAVADAFHISDSAGTNLSGSVAVPDTGAWQTWTNVTATVTLPAGVQTLTLDQDEAGWNINYFSFTSGSGGGGGGNGPKMFAPYIDMSITADENIVTIQQQSGVKAFTLAFLDAVGACDIGWGGLGGTLPTDTLADGTSILTLVQQLQAAGVTVVYSIGGANGIDPAAYCTSASSLQAVYQTAVSRYGIKYLDFDIEGAATDETAEITLRDKALVGLEAANPGLVISYTIPVLPTGLVANDGLNLLSSAKSDGVALSVVNIMTMDYGTSGIEMGSAATEAAGDTETQIQQAGLSATVGITPMIGQNDSGGEIFTLADANTLLNFANAHSYVSRLAMWSMGRDNGSCAGDTSASPSCSGVTQSNYEFSGIFKAY
jgi:hypothetical protein